MLWTISNKLQVGISASSSKENFYKQIKGINYNPRRIDGK
jgi:hypothetical protein